MKSSIIISFLFRFPFVTSNGTTPELSPCGTRSTNFRKPLIVGGGAVSAAGQWPWHASIWQRASRTTHVYVCGGTLVSELYVLTAGHCVSKDGNALNERLLAVQMGSVRQNLLLGGLTVQNFAVADVFLHEQFTERSFQADIALLALRTKANVDEFVRPICLPKPTEDAGQLTGREAVTVGFGMTGSAPTSDQLRQLRVPIVDYVTCLESNREVFGRALSAGILCAGSTAGSTVCNGDSGGGLFTEEDDGSWTLRGVTSFTVQRGWNDSSCSLKDYSAFVNVARYLEWIRYVVQNGEQEGFFRKDQEREITEAMKVKATAPEVRISDKKCREYRKRGLTVDASNVPGQFYLEKDGKPLGLVHFISNEYALTTAEMALDCVKDGAACESFRGTRVQAVIAHPEYSGGRDFNVALVLMPPATEPIWCLATEPSSKLYFEGRQLKLSAVSAERPTWLEFDLDAFIPSKRGAVVYTDRRYLAGLMHYPPYEDVVMTNVTAVLGWIESVVW
ncbi:clotting factor B [Culex quinquefasciatus]|uniref:clotting factor B n=1 Tax=Culex quinquefasciatus TaxID=7176 RepID=UPI0018E3519A|nr:clotting factor B [Culex quinquefasciatus]